MSKAEHIVITLLMAILLALGAYCEMVDSPRPLTNPTCPVPAYSVQEKLYHWSRANALDDAGNLAAAITEYEATLCVDPSDPTVKEELDSAKRRLYVDGTYRNERQEVRDQAR